MPSAHESSSHPSENAQSNNRRESVIDRRSGLDRRDDPTVQELAASGLDRRRGAGRRLADSLRDAEEGQFSREQFLFVKAIDAFKSANGVQFPAWTDVLEVVRLLGYRKTNASEINLPACEDWTEKPDTASQVRPRGFERRLGATQGQPRPRREAA